MIQEDSSLLDESIQLELNTAELYKIFHKTFSEDVEFWWRLYLEEENHAALIRSGKENFLPLGKFPLDLVSKSLEELKQANAALLTFIKTCRETPPSREEAFNIAIEVEESAGEIHFQEFMERKAKSNIDDIFQRLNKEDKDHAIRIRSYMEDQGIKIRKKDDISR